MYARILLIPKRENPPTITANTASSTGKPVAHFSRTHVASIPEKISDGSTGELGAETLIAEFQVYLIQPFTKKIRIARKPVKRLIQQFENHPNRESSIQDLNKTEEFNPFSEKSQELNTEYFELCETSSKIQCPDCALYWEAGIIYFTGGKCMQPTERNRQLNKARYDVLPIPGYVIKKNPTHGARHGHPVRQTMYHKAHDMLKKACKHKSGGYSTILDRLHDDDK